MVAPDTEWAKDILQLYFTLIPIILVFQGLELQIWIDQVKTLQGEYEGNPDRFKGMTGEIARKELYQRIERCKARYPSSLSIVLLIAVLLTVALSMVLGYIQYYTNTIALLFVWGSLVMLLIVIVIGLVMPERAKKKELQELLETISPKSGIKLLKELDAKLEVAESKLEGGEAEIILMKSLWDQLELIVGELVADGTPLDWPKTLGANPYTREYQLTERTIRAVRAKLKEMIK